MDWTKRVLARFEEPLKQDGVFGAVGVSQFPYHFDANIWRAFCKLWGPLTNTLHHGAGKVGISLYDLERVGGHNKYPAAVAELLRIHAELCEFFTKLSIFIMTSKYLVYFAYGEQTDSEKEKVEIKKRSPLRISRQKRIEDLNITAEGELAAFLAFWLSRFVLPHDSFLDGFWATSYIYHDLGDAASNPNYPELFPCLYRRRPDSDCPDDFSTLVCHAGLLGSKLSLPQARHIFRDVRYLSLRASSYRENSRNGRDMIDMGLPEKFLLSIRSAVLPVRVGAELILEPYYPNRFARQFGFDQEVPSNRLSFIRALRQQRSVMDLAQAYADLQRRDTEAKFYIPPSYYKGVCSWDYCRWWTKISTPYLSQSVERVHHTTTNKNELLREVVSLFLELLKFRELQVIIVPRGDPSLSSSEKGKKKVSSGNRRPQKKNKRTPNDQSSATANSHDQSPIEVNFKRARYDRLNPISESSD
ncbi:hypothetical protein Cgig2_018832 [Carnegiea gigantea]|uniref:Aminotransferase-like plant mobile domain-containing protein n=1 Tax=Carnegiea gigantea TaxID=171969 RepID=A0A9Q1QIT8_9CARY|nr:hypothetical protein Cgig2_018832 [Carnegiea gigantea]